MREAVTRDFKDPLSAQFSDVYAVKQDKDASYICGWVNAKNSYGGYVGRTRFVANKLNIGKGQYYAMLLGIEDREKKFPTFESRGTDKPETAFESVMWNKYCSDERHPKTYTADSS